MPFDETVTLSETKLTLGQICQQIYGMKYPSSVARPDCVCNPMENSQPETTYNANPAAGCSIEAGCEFPRGNTTANATATTPTWTPCPCWNPSPWHNTSPLRSAVTCFKALHLWNSSSNEETTPRELAAFCDESNAMNCNAKNETTCQNTFAVDQNSKFVGVFMPRVSLLPALSPFLACNDAQNESKIETKCDMTQECNNNNTTCPRFSEAPSRPSCADAPLSCPTRDEEQPSCSNPLKKLNVQNCCWGSCYPNCCGSCMYSCCDPCWPRTAICGNTSPCFSTSPWCQKTPCWNLTPWCYNNSCCNQCRW